MFDAIHHNKKIYKAVLEDLSAIRLFLLENSLRPSVSISQRSIYLYIKENATIIATIGAEINHPCALIRAAGVREDYRNAGLGKHLFESLERELALLEIRELYLFSRQAPDFWSKMGFSRCEVQEIMQHLSDTEQVKEFLLDNSIWTDVAWKKSRKFTPKLSNSLR